MGVPYLFKWISMAYPRIFMEKMRRVYVYYIDVNCVFHDVMNKMNEAGVQCERTYFEAVVAELRSLIKDVAPEHVFIAVDGVVPAAKMKQQRTRRYKAEMESSTHTQEKYFKNIELSPQMPLMQRLEAFIEEAFKDAPYEVTMSKSSVAGEGEHKILAHIRANDPSDICVYGTDGDWLLLTLPLKDMVIVKDHFESQYYIDTAALKQEFFSRFSLPNQSLEDCMRDVLFLSFLVGNDFVPRLYCISLRIRDAHLQAFSVLAAVYRRVGEQLISTTNTIHVDALFRFFAELQREENALIEVVVDMELNYVRHLQHQYRVADDREEFKREFMLPFRRTITPSSITHPSHYRQRYYQHHLKNHAQMDWIRLEVVMEYLKALDWTLQYYCGNLRDWHYAYPYSVAPFVDDVVRVNRVRDEVFPVEWRSRNDITIDVQLLLIVPQSRLPPHLRALSKTTPLEKYFPTRVEVETMDRVRKWECECDMMHPTIDAFVRDYTRARTHSVRSNA